MNTLRAIATGNIHSSERLDIQASACAEVTALAGTGNKVYFEAGARCDAVKYFSKFLTSSSTCGLFIMDV
jgi:hypothetical protein